MNRFRKIKIVLYLAGIFFAGIVTGVFISFQVVRHMMPNQTNMTEHWSRQLQSRLDLSPEQMRKIKPDHPNNHRQSSRTLWLATRFQHSPTATHKSRSS